MIASVALLFAAGAAPDPTLEAVLRDLCGQRVAMLGEADHGDGTTIAFKAALTRALVERCGFDTVLFEASHYEFAALEQAAASPTPDDIGRAMGGLWNGSREIAPLLDFLAQRRRAGRVRLGGIDDQPGSRGGRYDAAAMAGDLAAGVPEAERAACRDRIERRIAWRYDASRPYAVERTALRACLATAGAAGEGRAAHLARVLLRHTDRDDAARPDAIAARDRAMADIVGWYLATGGRPRRAIVWAATSHVATVMPIAGRSSGPTLGGLLRARYGRGAVAIGFTTQGGTTRPSVRGPERAIAPTVPGALEQVAGPRGGVDRVYCARVCLTRAGARPAGFLFHDPVVADWGRVLDGAVIFARETAVTASDGG